MFKYIFIFLFLTIYLLPVQAQDKTIINTSSQISDEEILKYQQQIQSSNLSIQELESLLAAKGLSPSEIAQLKQRILSNQKNTNTTPITFNKREVPVNDYKTFSNSTSSKVFGSELFSTPSLSFEPNLRIATPTNYIIGPDDELLINVSGYQEANLKLPIQPEGSISIPQVGMLNVAGLTMNEASSKIKARMAQTAYPTISAGRTQVSITLGKIRSIHITVVGATKPGNYTVSSLTTVFNALFICGGPGAIHTFREIELIRNNRVYKKIDLYKFLTRGEQSGNVLLQENDVINFPVYKNQVKIAGEVKRPGIFEILPVEKLDNILFFAGGYTEKAYKASIKVKQITDTERRIKDISKLDFANYSPSNGDEFTVDAILERIDNAVSISGGVYRPGEFELIPNLTLKGLIEKAGGLVEGVFKDRGILIRIKEDKTKETIPFNVGTVINGQTDFNLVKGDQIQIATLNQFRQDYTVTIEGEVRKPGTYPFTEKLALKDLFFQAGGFTDAGSTYHLEVSRRIISERSEKPTDSIAKVFDINLEREISLMDDQFVLQANDIVTVRKNPGYIAQQRVSISGEINYPGTYTIQRKNEKISDLVKRAGGLTAYANMKGIFLIRNNTTSATVKRDKAEKVTAIKEDLKDSSIDVVQDILNPTTKIAINYKEIEKNPLSNDNYILLEGDNIEIPVFDPLVKMSGEVLMPTQTNFEGKLLRYYLGKSGGTTDNAKRSKIFVIYANGEVNQTNNGFFGILRSFPKIEAGTEIIVPNKAEKRKFNTGEAVGISTALVSLVSLVLITISALK